MNCTDYTIRKITVSELPRLTELFNYNDIDSMISENTSLIQNGSGDIFILLEGEKILGELHVRYENNDPLEAVRCVRAYLYAYRVHKDSQGIGLGKLLMKTVIDTLAAEGYSEFTIGVEDDNDRALHIYKAFGFSEVVSRKYEEYQGDGYEYNLYLKRLL
ncbi:MAG: GNAT family N-acetyltransferase [Oscillospiraceae bacterium]|nr:GNAT family N-acetyltransferase [Oscillospiraceae bacterium]